MADPAETGKEGWTTRYRVYTGPKGSDDISPLTKQRMLFKEFSALDEALSWACQLSRPHACRFLIEGNDRTRMDRRVIGDALPVGEREQVCRWRLASKLSERAVVRLRGD